MPWSPRNHGIEKGLRYQDGTEGFSKLRRWIVPRTPPGSNEYLPRCEASLPRTSTSQLAIPTISTLSSLSSSALLGPQLVSSLGLPSPICWLPALLDRISNSIPVVVSMPKTAQLVLTLHYYCLTTLSLYKIRGNSRGRKTLSGIVLLLGLAVYSPVFESDVTWTEREAEVVTILPLLISLSLLLSASFHAILNRYQRTTLSMSISTEKG